MNLYLLIVAALWRMMSDIASTKTQRYFLSSLEKRKTDDDANGSPEYPKLVCDVVRTFCEVMTKRAKSSRIEAEGEYYPVSDFEFPENWWKLTAARLVFASRGSIEYAAPYYQYQGVGGEFISPSRIKRFFEAFNQNQTEETRFQLCGVPSAFDDYAYLTQFKTLTIGDSVADWNSGGEIDEMVAQILEIPCPVKAEYVKTWEKFEERSVDKWLMSVK